MSSRGHVKHIFAVCVALLPFPFMAFTVIVSGASGGWHLRRGAQHVQWYHFGARLLGNMECHGVRPTPNAWQATAHSLARQLRPLGRAACPRHGEGACVSHGSRRVPAQPGLYACALRRAFPPTTIRCSASSCCPLCGVLFAGLAQLHGLGCAPLKSAFERRVATCKANALVASGLILFRRCVRASTTALVCVAPPHCL